ncbi:MAG: WapI family immunity protein [Dyella sp.]|uniref:WapI family immunity protein n=1 Tax=Dyella sp. TaxID=1869338 RepID=UPI003F7F1044
MTDALLSSSFSSEFLAFRSIERFEDGSGYSLHVELQAGPFSASYPFFVESHPVKKFLASLGTLQESLSGEALLKPEYEPQFILIRAGVGGHMVVSGELFVHSDQPQSLKFQFRTDQTCVGLFLQKLRHELAAVTF